MPMYHARKSARLAVHVALVLASAVPSWALTGNSAPNGLVVVIENKPQENRLDLRALENPYISGVALQIRWRDIEPVQGKPDWSKLNQLFSDAESSKKWVQLLIFPGFFAPAWAIDGAKGELFAIQYGPDKGTVEAPHALGYLYLTRWFTFYATEQQVRKSPLLRDCAAGPTSVSADSRCQARRRMSDMAQCGIYSTIYSGMAEDLPSGCRTPLISTFLCRWGLVLIFITGVNARVSANAPGKQLSTRPWSLGRRFALQFSNLDGIPDVGPGPRAAHLVIGYNGRIITGFQLRTSCDRHSGNMGAEGDARSLREDRSYRAGTEQCRSPRQLSGNLPT